MSRDQRFDDAVVGAGLLGLALAYHLARRGRSVVVVERADRAEDVALAFSGMIRPIDQPAGPLRRMALRSREVWLDVLGVSGLWHERTGSFHLAYRDPETAVLREFASRAGDEGFRCELLNPEAVVDRAPRARRTGLIAGLFSPWEVGVDAREVAAGLPAWLDRVRGVRFAYGQTVIDFEPGRVRTTTETLTAHRLWLSADDDLERLAPIALAERPPIQGHTLFLRLATSGARPRPGPMLAGGLTLRHSRAFAGCPSHPFLNASSSRGSSRSALNLKVTAAHDAQGRLTVAAYQDPDNPSAALVGSEIDRLILDELATFVDLDFDFDFGPIEERRQNLHRFDPANPYQLDEPAPGIAALTCVGEAAPTLAFGLAEHVIDRILGGD